PGRDVAVSARQSLTFVCFLRSPSYPGPQETGGVHWSRDRGSAGKHLVILRGGPMRGVVFLGDRRLELREFPDPTPGPGEVVLAIKASGMCGSDLHTYRAQGGTAAIGIRGRTEPVIAGHEPCGVVAAVGPGVSEAQARLGQRVMNHHYAGCGVCKHCRT